MPFPFNCCCQAKTSRSDIYRAAPNNEESEKIPTPHASLDSSRPAGSSMANNTTEDGPPKYSWDRRREEGVDLSKYQVKNIDGDFVLKEDINGQQMVIENCKRSVIAVLDVTGSVVIDDCIDCTIVVGPCNGSLFIRGSNNCRLFYVGQQFRLRDCRDIDIAIHCKTQPIIESATVIRFYPLSLYYPKLQEHLRVLGISPFGVGSRSIHDYTPSPDSLNYELCNDQLRMDLASIRELRRTANISLDYSDSLFVQRQSVAPGVPRTLLIAVQRTYERHDDFYNNAFEAAKHANEQNLKITDIAEGVIDEELGDLLKSDFAAEIGNRLIILDVAGPVDAVTSLIEGEAGRTFRRLPHRYDNEIQQKFFP